MKRIINGLFVGAGFLCMGLGLIGTVLPVLPTVPFLLAAAVCFAKGSQRFHRWFLGTKLYQDNLNTLVRHRAMTMRKKRRVLVMVTALMVFAGIMMPKLWMRIMLAAILLAHYYAFLIRIPTISDAEEARLTAEEKGVPE